MTEGKLSWTNTPGETKGISPFDALYGLLTVTLVQVLGSIGKLLPSNRKWKPGEKLQVLFVAYSGARNTGAEVRVAECIRQVHKVLGGDHVDINMSTLDLKEASEYFKGYPVNLKEFSTVFFGDIFRLVRQNHLIVLVEGSCWKENFAAALLLYFLYGAGLAAKLGKPCFSYAVDAGKMNKLNNYLSNRLSRKMTRIITRSEDSSKVLESLGLRVTSTRVDTAWTQEAESPEYAAGVLRGRGWDGKKPLVALAMQNFQRWPVVPNVPKYLKSLFTGDRRNQYKLIYYYDYSAEDEKAYREWATMLGRTMDWLTEEYAAQPVLVAMEALDEESCKDVAGIMKSKAILISCNEFVGVQIASILRTLSLLITTRYHAMVLSMPGKIPFVGLSRDERIRGVMKELGLYEDYYLDYHMDALESKLRDRVSHILGDAAEAARLTRTIDEHLPYYYAQMAMLGLDVRDLVRESFPGLSMAPLDEKNPMDLIPFAPREYVDRVHGKFLEIRAREGKSG